jgi:fructose-1,6-bisphosphatase II
MMDKNLALELVRVTEAAAISAGRWVGRGNQKSADQAAVTQMRKRFSIIDIDGTVVIGEGERDKAPMLFIGEKVGTGNGPKVDIAVDPLEGTRICAIGEPNALSCIAAAPAGTLLHAPDCYMDKIAVGKEAAGKVDLDNPIKRNIKIVAHALEKEVEDVTVIVLNRPRHQKLIDEIRSVGARIQLIQDGDIAGSLAPGMNSAVDILLGIGSAPEGVISACALKCLGGEIQGRLVFKDKDMKENYDMKERAKEMGLKIIDE